VCVCVCICIYMYICIYIYIYIYILTRSLTLSRTHTHTHTHTQAYPHMHMYARKHTLQRLCFGVLLQIASHIRARALSPPFPSLPPSPPAPPSLSLFAALVFSRLAGNSLYYAPSLSVPYDHTSLKVSPEGNLNLT
jgi:hypothetical protein